jgi:hypothetical protein
MRLPLALLAAAMMTAPAVAQIKSTVEVRYAIAGITDYVAVGRHILVPQGTTPRTVAVGYVELDVVEADGVSISVKASDAKRVRVPVERVPADQVPDRDGPVFLVFGQGRLWLEVFIVDFNNRTTTIDETEIHVPDGPAPPPPPDDDDDDPDPPPTPDVPPDAFENIGQRVAVWANGLPDRPAVAPVWRTAARMLREDPTKTVNDASAYIVAEMRKVTNYDAWGPLRANVNADLQTRWAATPMARGVLADYFDAVANGIGAIR